MPLNEALKRRRSQRSFSEGDLKLEQVSQLLWAAQGVTEPSRGFRTAPSAGALYPLELYVLEKGVLYHYMPASHSMEVVSKGVDAGRLADAAARKQFVAQAQAVFVIGAVFERRGRNTVTAQTAMSTWRPAMRRRTSCSRRYHWALERYLSGLSVTKQRAVS